MLHHFCARIVTGATWMLMASLVLVVTFNVIARYCFQTGLLWAEEVSRLIFVWVVFLGSYLALRRKSHMAIDLVFRAIPATQQRVMTVLGGLLALFFFFAVAYGGAVLLATTLEFGRTTAILGISAAWSYASVPVAALCMFCEVLHALFSGGSVVGGEELQ